MLSLQMQKECKQLLRKYKTVKSRKTQVKVRNQLYEKMQDVLLVWTKAVLADMRVFEEDEGAIRSSSFMAFMHALERYDEKYPVAKHFHQFTKYYLLTEKRNTNNLHKRRRMYQEALPPEAMFMQTVMHHGTVENLMVLKAFRNVLDPLYQKVLDDAITSLAPKNNDRTNNLQEMKLLGMREPQYKEAKKIFQILVTFFLKGTSWKLRTKTNGGGNHDSYDPRRSN